MYMIVKYKSVNFVEMFMFHNDDAFYVSLYITKNLELERITRYIFSNIY